MAKENFKPVVIKDDEPLSEIPIIPSNGDTLPVEPIEKPEFPSKPEEPILSDEAKEAIKEKIDAATVTGKEALQLMIDGARVRLPGWTGQWKAVNFIHEGVTKHVIRVLFADGSWTDTPIIEYMLMDGWELVPEDEYIN